MRFRHDWLLHLYFNRDEKDLEIGLYLRVLSPFDRDNQADISVFT